jgi:hypothetical protein
LVPNRAQFTAHDEVAETQLVGPGDDRVDDASADVVLVGPTSARCGEREVIAREAVRCRAVLRELVLEDGHVEDPFAGLGLRPAGRDLGAG